MSHNLSSLRFAFDLVTESGGVHRLSGIHNDLILNTLTTHPTVRAIDKLWFSSLRVVAGSLVHNYSGLNQPVGITPNDFQHKKLLCQATFQLCLSPQWRQPSSRHAMPIRASDRVA